MRDKSRIARILNLIEAIWINAPDLRLGQLLSNYAGFDVPDIYPNEDDKTEEILLESYNKIFFQNEEVTAYDILKKAKQALNIIEMQKSFPYEETPFVKGEKTGLAEAQGIIESVFFPEDKENGKEEEE